MSGFTPTEDQKKAIETRGSAVLVSAGAGSGKTKVLTERLMGYICPKDGSSPQNIDRFVVITYTKAAAAELKGRIAAEIAHASASAPSDENLRKQQALIRRTHIGTIHSFCSSLLKEYSRTLDIPANFKIIGDERAEEMKAGALKRVMEDSYSQMAEYAGFEDLVNSVGAGRDDSRLEKLVLTLYEKMQCHPRPEQWARKTVSGLVSEGDPGESAWGRVLVEDARSRVRYWIQEMEELMELTQPDEQLRKSYLDGLAETGEYLREFERRLNSGWEKAGEMPEPKFANFKPYRGTDGKELAELAKDRRGKCKDDLKKLNSVFRVGRDEISAEMKANAPAMEALLSLVLRFSAEYSKEKLKKGFLDYSDLEHKAAELLITPDGRMTDAAAAVSEKYAEIMVDEYQDVSHVQDEIFKAVSGDGKKLFMVGDVKQSIYRFRLADPEIFNSKYRDYKTSDEAAEGKPRKILLRENFRSRKSIIDCANAVFSRCMSKELGDVEYDGNAALVFGASGYEGEEPLPEMYLLNLPKHEPGTPKQDKNSVEAAFVAEKIRSLVSSKLPVRCENGTRPVEYGDIAILLRSPGPSGAVYRRELVSRGIPVAAGQGGAFFEAGEVSFVLSILKIIDNPHKDIPLIAALSSPAFGFTPDELSEIRAAAPESGFYAALKARAETDNKCSGFLEMLRSFRKEAPDLTCDDLIWMILEKTGLYSVCAAMPDGEQRTGNLMHLISLAVRFEEDGNHGLHRFILWLERMAEKEEDGPVSGIQTSAVRIMSMHRSKGLEFPVVFLCNLSKNFNLADSRETVLVHPELGLGPSFVDRENMAIYPTFARKAIAMQQRKETVSEEMRLLYVALTRPKEYLFMTACVRDTEKFRKKISGFLPLSGEKVSPVSLSACSSHAEWLAAAAMMDREQHLKLTDETFTPENCADEPELPEQEKHDETIYRELKRNLSFEYGHADAGLLPSKATVTELKGYEQPEDSDSDTFQPSKKFKVSFRRPDFRKNNRPVTGAEKGIATHLALQYINLEGLDAPENVAKEIERLKDRKFLSERQADSVDREAIRKLFASELGKRICGAKKIMREFRFSLLVPAEEIFGRAEGEEILLQGVVDCCLEENGKLVIIDYKTDYVRTEADIREKCELYSTQVKTYASAMKRIFGMEVRETVLYFLSTGTAVSL